MFALERISFQLKSKLGNALYALTKQTQTAIDAYIRAQYGTTISRKANLNTLMSTYIAEYTAACSDVIFSETGMEATIIVDPKLSNGEIYNAFMFPNIDKQNEKTLVDTILNMKYRSEPDVKSPDPLDAIASIDRNRGTFIKAPKGYKITITLNLSFFLLKYLKGFKDIEPMSPRHITAVILHEIGHGFTFIEYYGRIISETTAFRDQVETLSKTPEKLSEVTSQLVLKYVKDPKLVKEYEDLIGKAGKLPATQSAYINSITLTSFITKLIMTSAFSQAEEFMWGKPVYTDQVYTPYLKTMSERIADEFVNTHGFGQPLAEALRILHQFHIDRSSTFVRKLNPVFYVIVRAFQEIFPNPNLMDGETVYEHPVERLKQIEMNYIDLIKVAELNEDVRKQYLDQIKFIREEVKKMEKVWAPEESRLMLRIMKKISSFSSGLLANANLVADYAALQRLTKHFIQNPVYYHAQVLKNVVKGSSRKG